MDERLLPIANIIREVVREEFARVLDAEENAVADCIRELAVALDKRLERVELSCGILVDGQKFLEKYLADTTTPQEDEPWRESE